MSSHDNDPDSFKELVGALAKLPGVGPKTAQRYAFIYCKLIGTARDLSDSIINAIKRISNCRKCNTLCEGKVCKICTDSDRDPTKLCIVESPSDLLAVEQSHAFEGLYFVLMGKVSFIDGVGPKDLSFERLFSRAEEEEVKEIIVATNFTAEGEATAQAIESLFKQHSKTKKKSSLVWPEVFRMERNLNTLISEQLRRLLERERRKVNMDKISFWCFFTAGILPIICAGISKSKKIMIMKIRENGLLFKPVLENGQILLSRIVGNHSSGFLPL